MNDAIMRNIGFGKEVDRIKAGRCAFCDEVIDNGAFKDDLSLKEFNISGLCQACQDEVFTEIDDMEEGA